jgi:RNA polymerase sigma-70 factor (ECF subfamily)
MGISSREFGGLTSSTYSRDDCDTQLWLAGLRADGRERDRTIVLLHVELLRVARMEVRQRRTGRSITGPELDDLAHQAAADAMMAIISKLDDFRGESKFTTWAYRFVALDVMHKLGRHFWLRPVVPLENAEAAGVGPATEDPEQVVRWRALLKGVSRAVDQDLTARQRSAFVELVWHGNTAEGLARQLGTNRDAVYKLVFDARRKIRARLTADGLLEEG